jgi:hypothetical protein
MSPYDIQEPIGAAAGGYVGLNSLLGQMNLGPGIGGGRIGVSPAIANVGSVAMNEPAHTRSAAAQASGGGQGANVTFGDINIMNPRPEMASTSLTHSTQRAAFLAGRQIG